MTACKETTPTLAISTDTSTASNQPLPDLFLLEKDFEEDFIHKLVADNLYAIPTQGRGCPRKIDANKIETVSKLYTAQIQEVCTGSNPNMSSNLLPLKGVQFSIPLETIEANFPEIGQSLCQYFDTLGPLGIHLLNLQSKSYTKCNYADISVNKVKVRVIIDSGPPSI